MKKLSVLSLLGVVLFTMTLVGCNKKSTQTDQTEVDNSVSTNVTSSETDPKVDYNDTLVGLASSCTKLEDTIRTVYDETYNIEDIKTSVNNMLAECSNILESIYKVGDLEGDSSLKDGVAVIVEKEIAYYTKLIDILPYLDVDELTEEENEIYESIRAELEVIDKELTNSNDDFIRIQEDFSNRHGYRLEGYEYTDGEDNNV